MRIKEASERIGRMQKDVAADLGISPSALSQYANGKREPDHHMLTRMADYFGVSVDYLLGRDVDFSDYAPMVTEDVVTFPIIGEVAAGYDHMPVDVDGERIDIPRQYLHGRPMSDFFVLRVKGDSMYPSYQDGDLVLVLRQSTCNRSGDVAVVIYGDEAATLKKIEYVTGEDWMKLIPLNPLYPPVRVEDEKLEHCRVLGLPKMLIREIKD